MHAGSIPDPCKCLHPQIMPQKKHYAQQIIDWPTLEGRPVGFREAPQTKPFSCMQPNSTPSAHKTNSNLQNKPGNKVEVLREHTWLRRQGPRPVIGTRPRGGQYWRSPAVRRGTRAGREGLVPDTAFCWRKPHLKRADAALPDGGPRRCARNHDATGRKRSGNPMCTPLGTPAVRPRNVRGRQSVISTEFLIGRSQDSRARL